AHRWVAPEQTHDRLFLPERHVVVAGNLAPLKVSLPIDDQRPAAAIENLAPNHVGGIAVPKLYPAAMIVARADVVPVNRRIAGNHAQLPAAAERPVHRAHGPDELLCLVAEAVHDGVLFPGLAEHLSRHILSADKPVDCVLIPRAGGF